MAVINDHFERASNLFRRFSVTLRRCPVPQHIFNVIILCYPEFIDAWYSFESLLIPSTVMDKKSEALKLVMSGEKCVPEVAQKYGISESTLFRWKSQGSVPLKGGGKSTTFSMEEEQELCSLVISLANVGAPLSQSDLLELVAKVAVEKGKQLNASFLRPERISRTF